MSQVKSILVLLLVAILAAVAVNASMDTFDILSDFISMSDATPRRSSSSSSYSRRPTSNSYRRPTSNNRRPTSYNRRPTTNTRRPTTYSRRPTTNTRRPTTNNRRPTSNTRRPTTRPTRTNNRNGNTANNRRRPSNTVRPGVNNQQFSDLRRTQSSPYANQQGANTQSNTQRQPAQQPAVRNNAPSSQVVQSAMSNVRSASHSQSTGKCAKYTANAIEKALTGKTYTINRPASAKDFGSWLQKMGYQKVSGPMQPGDVQVFQAIPGHPDGHMQMLTNGGQFISDFRQRDMYPGPSYRNTHQVPSNYRYVGNGNQ